MELKVSSVKNKSMMSYTGGNNSGFIETDSSMERYPITADIDLCRQQDNYYIFTDARLLPITEQEAVAIYEHPENVYDIIIDKTRKFHFSASEDNLNITIGNM